MYLKYSKNVCFKDYLHQKMHSKQDKIFLIFV
jgi:hypothetical protein